MSENLTPPVARRRRFTPVALATGAIGAVLLSLSLTGTLSGFVASITNTTNTAATGYLEMKETGPGGTSCTSSSSGSTTSCATINKFGGSKTMVPGTSASTKVTIENTGTVDAASFTLKPGATCAQAPLGANPGTATDLCEKLDLVITQTGNATPVFTGTAKTLAGSSLTLNPVTAGSSAEFTFKVTLNASANSTYQALEASLPLEWIFAS